MTFHKYPKIGRFGEARVTDELLSSSEDIIIAQEKIDGANFRFMPSEDGRVVFGSRNLSIGDSTNDIGGNWNRCVKFILEKLNGKDLSEYTDYIFYGECCIPHSIQYTWEKIPAFLGFDIMKGDKFLDYEETKIIYEKLGLPMVPLISINTASYYKEIKLSENDIPNSVYYMGKSEGIVLKNYRTQTFCKFVSEKFKEVNKATFGSSAKRIEDDSEKLVAIYCTNPRIDKKVFELVNNGNELHMRLMKQLPQLVWRDIVDEHATEILNKKWKIDIEKCRKSVALRCKSVLEQIISMQAVVNTA